MKAVSARAFGLAALAIGAGAALQIPMTSQASAAQPWHCTCQGKDKRFLASTRHCEHQMKLPKGKSCSADQWRKVYGPACKAKGCRLPPLN